jgi:threonine synthase
MKYYSTKDKNTSYSLQEAVLAGLPPDNGLFMPEVIPQLQPSFISALHGKELPEIAYEISKAWFKDDVPDEVLQKIASEAYSFDAPLVSLDATSKILELFHGPTAAFKDFGARFMSRLMSWMERDATKPLTILVATSGDTGSAVASGFHGVKGINVVILYPSGKVSPLQEKQLTTWGDNITALEVHGTFDDCQAMVKEAFLDQHLKSTLRLSSANSINIARLLPQSFYYFRAVAQLDKQAAAPVFVVPSGNFGNLVAGLFAKRSGLPIAHFVAATNANDIVPHYLQTGNFTPRPSVQTISNAMDVGNPSNFARMMELFNNDRKQFTDELSGFSFTDVETSKAIADVYSNNNYLLDTHGAVGYLAWKAYEKKYPEVTGIILETAHPAKFSEPVKAAIGREPAIPERLEATMKKEKVAIQMQPSFSNLKDWLIALASN